MADRRSPINGAILPEGRPFKQGEEQRERARRAGQASGRKRRQLRTLKEQFEALLAEKRTDSKGNKTTVQAGMAIAIMKQALEGNVRAAEYIRDVIGQKPVETVNVNAPDPDVMQKIREQMESFRES